MSKVEIVLSVATNLENLAESLKIYADTIIKDEGFETIYTPEQEVQETVKAEKVSRTDVRAKLADLARNGFGDEVKSILKKHGADRFSEIQDSDLPALMKEAEAVGS